MQPELLGLGRGEFASPRSISRPDRPDAGGSRPDVGRPRSGEGDGDAVRVTLSEEAQRRLAADGAASRPDPPAVAPSEPARPEVAATPGPADLPFGEIVSAIARQLDLSGLFAPAAPATAPTASTSSDDGAPSVRAAPEQPADRERPGSRVSLLA